MVSPVGPSSIGLTDKQYQEWLEYRDAGGFLNLQEWVSAGFPTITEEQASVSWMKRLDAYLVSQLEAGNIDQSEADVLWDDLQDRLFGAGKYVGKRKTVIDLPAAILSDVERYWAGLPVAAQKEAEQAAKVEAQKLRDIASQRMGLPLYAGGTKEQQILTGQRAIRNLQIQMQTAPQHLQSEIRNQIEQLEQGVNQIRESINMEAWLRTRKEEKPKIAPGDRPLPAAEQFAKKYGMSPEAAGATGIRYFANPEDPEYANLTLEQRQDLVGVGIEIQGANELRNMPPPPAPFSAPGVESVGITGPPAWKSWFEQNYPSIVKRYGQTEDKTYAGWNVFLERERARLKEEFASRPAYARGERPGAFAPKVKTVAF